MERWGDPTYWQVYRTGVVVVWEENNALQISPEAKLKMYLQPEVGVMH